MSGPYYASDLCRLYLGDLREETAWTTADVLVVDPPYGIDYVSRAGKVPTQRIAGDADLALRAHILAMWGDRPALVFGSPKQPPPPGTQAHLVWDKMGLGPGMGDLRSAFGLSHEEMYVLGEWPRTRRRHGSVFRTADSPKALSVRYGHPTAKPVNLISTLLSLAPKGAVADPCAGTGSTLVAATLAGRPSIGVEISERWCEAAATRLSRLEAA